MKNDLIPVCALTLCLFLINCALADDNWPQFRGRQADGHGSGKPPVKWNVESGENVCWKMPIKGLGLSSPVVWDDRIFLTTATSAETEKPSLQTGWLGGTGKAAKDSDNWSWHVICLDLKNGKQLWSREVHAGKPEIKRHLKASHANCTPATDGKYVVAFFGSEGLYCLDFAGNQKWKKNFGRLHAGPYNAKKLEWGFASSPVIHADQVVVQCDCLNTNFIAKLDIATGEETGRIVRDDVATWSTPGIFKVGGRTQIVCNGYQQMAGYDFDTAELLWTLSGGGDVPVPTPLLHNDRFILTNGHGRNPTFAVKSSARGNVTPIKDSESLPDGLAWYQPRDGSYMPTPIVVDGQLYTCNDNGVLAVRNAATGKLIYKQRVSTGTNNFSASAVSANGHIYFSSEQGKIIVIEAGEKFNLVATNDMRAVVMATPAISGDRILIRTVDELVCIGP